MIIKNLKLKGFRNFEELEFFPGENMNVIFGDNAEGKTNLLEAIWLFCGAKSFRGAKDKELVSFGKNFAVNECEFTFGGVEKFARITIEEKRSAELSGNKLSSAGGLAGKFFAIVFSPLDINLVNDGPAARRRFLDTAIGQIYPSYNEKLRKYVKAVKQRNSLLKDLKYHPELDFLMEDFEEALSHLAGDIVKYRKKYIELLQKYTSEIYEGISGGKEELKIEYFSSLGSDLSKDCLKEMYLKSRREDIFSGATSIGPHRDDLLLTLDKKAIKSFGSQGQRRSVALSLKLSEAMVLKEITGEYPIALLDDVMSELDKGRQDFILNHIKNWQVFITCCDPANIDGLKEGKIFKMQGGKLVN
ncbi:MAG: DNA replication/repair protein RecF [Clostridia bacterium]|nr:DNA replication/repair protein RecF [Clostridia bacterium]